MKIKLRPLKGDTFEVDVEAEEKVEDLRKRVAELRPEFPAAQQKLIHAGKILADGTAVSTYGIKPSDFIVVMVSKPKTPAAQPVAAAQAAPAAPAVPAAPAQPAATVSPAPSQNAVTPAATPVPAATATAAAAPVDANAPPPVAVAQLCEMGFPRDQVEQCLRAAFMNADRAVEYLMGGIPASVAARAAQERDRSRSPRGGHGHSHSHGHGHDCSAEGHVAHGHEGHGHDCATDHGQGDCAGHDDHGGGNAHGHGHGAGGHGAGASIAPSGGLTFPALPNQDGSDGDGIDLAEALQALQSHPQFQELRGVILSNPQALPTMLEGMAEENPALVQAISENQEEFLQLLQGIASGEVGEEDEEWEDEGVDHGAVQVSEADQAAATRLAALGFSPERALEAYLACDRKEELAANYLFDNAE